MITLGENDLAFSGNDIAFASHLLTSNHRYSVAVRAVNAAGTTTSTPTIGNLVKFAMLFTLFLLHGDLGTHDITTATASANLASRKIDIVTNYAGFSNARGALFSFVFITDSGDVDFSKSFLLPLDRNTSHNHTLPFDLHPGRYRVYVYDIEHDGTLHNGVGYPAVTDELFFSGGNQGTYVLE